MAPDINPHNEKPSRQHRGGRRRKGKNGTGVDLVIYPCANSDDGHDVGCGVPLGVDNDKDDDHQAGGVALDGDLNDGDAGYPKSVAFVHQDGDALMSSIAAMSDEENLSQVNNTDVEGGGEEIAVKTCVPGYDTKHGDACGDTSSSARTANHTEDVASQPASIHAHTSDSGSTDENAATAAGNDGSETTVGVNENTSAQDSTIRNPRVGLYRPPHHRPEFGNGGAIEPAPACSQNTVSKTPSTVAGTIPASKSENGIITGAGHFIGLPTKHYSPGAGPRGQPTCLALNGAHDGGHFHSQQSIAGAQCGPAPQFYAHPHGITWGQYSSSQATVPDPLDNLLDETYSNLQETLPTSNSLRQHSTDEPPAVHPTPQPPVEVVPFVQQQIDPATITRSWPEVPTAVREQRSSHLNNLMEGLNGGGPTLADILAPDNFPFVETFTLAKPYNHGVVVIKNIPFETTRAEVIAFLGRNSKILNDAQEPVHIIIDRVTSKTKDAYVEFLTMDDAMRAVQRHQATVDRGRTARLGDRPVTVELSSIDTLMTELFPHAWVKWQNGSPFIHTAKDERYEWRNFKGFITEEEMTMLVKHVEQPHRTPFSKDCPQRPYECMISTISKMPWYCGEFITVKQRSAMHKAVMKLMHHLHNAIDQGRSDRTLTPALLRRLGTAAMACPGFSIVQKDNIAVLSRLDKSRDRAFNQPRGANLWIHQLTLGPKERVPMDVVEWYIAFLRDESTKFVLNKPMAERNAIIARATPASHYFGYLWYELGFPTGKDYDGMSLRQAADIELAAMERIIRRAFQA